MNGSGIRGCCAVALRGAAIVSLLLLAAAAPVAVAQESAAFDVEVTRVVVDVVVLDGEGNPIHGLGKDDFVLEDEGKAQEILEVTEEVLPEAKASSPSATPPAGAASAETPRGGGRLLVLVFDAVSLQAHGTVAAKRAAREMVASALASGDRVAVLRVASSVEVVASPTDDRDRLLAILAPEEGGAKGVVAPLEESGVVRPSELDASRRLFGVLEDVGKSLEPHPGRKLVFHFSDVGALTIPDFGMDSGPAATRRRDQAVRRARAFGDLVASLNASNVAVYTVSHLNGAPAMASASEREGSDALGAALDAVEGARTMAAVTGGLAITAGPTLGAGLARISDVTRSSYLVAFEPTERRKGGMRDVRVRCKRPGSRVLARKSYAAPVPFGLMDDDARDAQMEAALLSWFDLDALPVELHATVEKVDGRRRIQVAARVDGALVTQGKRGRRLDVLRALGHDDAARKVDRRTTEVVVPEGGDAVYEESLLVDPGVYTVRVVLRDVETGTMGSGTVRLTIDR